LRPDRLAEIHLQIADILSFFGAVDLLDPNRTPWTLELLDAGLRLAVMIEMRIKHALNVPRPVALSPRIQPVIQTPAHGSLPSGHATEAAIVATLLSHLGACRDVDPDADGARKADETGFLKLAKSLASSQHQRWRVAARIAVNRTIAGVHYPVDSAAGAVLGVTLGEYVAAMATGQARMPSRDFDGSQYAPNNHGGDFHTRALGQILTAGAAQNTGAVLDDPDACIDIRARGRHICALWSLALEEIVAQWPPQSANQEAGNG
jgi:membrane-associated phospholipid phosphatase